MQCAFRYSTVVRAREIIAGAHLERAHRALLWLPLPPVVYVVNVLICYKALFDLVLARKCLWTHTSITETRLGAEDGAGEPIGLVSRRNSLMPRGITEKPQQEPRMVSV
jgi:hypothetical protein